MITVWALIPVVAGTAWFVWALCRERHERAQNRLSFLLKRPGFYVHKDGVEGELARRIVRADEKIEELRERWRRVQTEKKGG